MKKIFTVTELNGQIKCLLEESFDLFWVEGEVSNLHRPASGHSYFTLKDENCQIRAVIFRSAGSKPFLRTGMLFELENGMSIICRARLSVYQPRGEYQLLIDHVEPLGLGALQKAFEQLKARLQAEGLFDPCYKKTVPYLPRCIGVITSPSGAVIRDILNVTRRRFPSVDIMVLPVSVQGREAAGEIVRAISDVQACGKVDVVILARGGGSLEDLAPFNDEGVARAIFNCSIPLVSAVGHETDFTIADFVADLRAPTPSAAAELVVPVKADVKANLEALTTRLMQHQRRFLERMREKVFACELRLPHPYRQIDDARLRIDAWMNRMQRVLTQQQSLHRERLLGSLARLRTLNLRLLIREARQRLENIRRGVTASGKAIWEDRKKRLEAALIMLDTLSPFAVLRRGYSIARALPEGLILKDASQLTEGKEVEVTLASGGFQAKVTEIYRSNDEWPRKNSKTR